VVELLRAGARGVKSVRAAVFGTAALSVCLLVLTVSNGHAQSPLPPPAAAPPLPGFVPPYEVAKIVQEAGYDPLTRPRREGSTYVVRANNHRGILMRIVVDARSGAIRAVNRIVPGPAPYGVMGMMPPGYGDPYDPTMGPPPGGAPSAYAPGGPPSAYGVAPYGPASGPPRYPQGYPSQGYPSQGYPSQGYPSQGYPSQGYPSQGYPSQGYPSQGYPQQAYPSQAYPPQAYPPPYDAPADYGMAPEMPGPRGRPMEADLNGLPPPPSGYAHPPISAKPPRPRPPGLATHEAKPPHGVDEKPAEAPAIRSEPPPNAAIAPPPFPIEAPPPALTPTLPPSAAAPPEPAKRATMPPIQD
jgi:hypothetical protein